MGWSIYLVTHFPGTAASDSVRILSNPIGMAGQHTLFYNLLLSGIFKLGTWITFGSSWGGAFLYSICQMVYIAYIISYIIEWMSHRNISPLITLAILFFYAVSPMVANIAILAVKDSIWGATSLLYIPFLMEIHDSQGLILQRKKKLLLFIFVSVILTLTRNNGKYVTFILLLGLLIAYKNKWKQILLIILLGVMLPIMVDSAIMKFLGQKKDFVESMALPLQQISMTVVSDGEINEKQKEVIDNIMSRENFEKYYAPCSVDSIKWGEGGKQLNKYYIRTNKSTFLLTWLSMFPSNICNYVKAFLLNSYGYWGFHVSTVQGYYRDYWHADDHVYVEHIQILPDSLETLLKDYYSSFKDKYTAGELFWVILFLFLLELGNRNGKWIVFVPFLSVWLILMLSAPIANGFRYVYPLYLSIPVLLGITIFEYDDAGIKSPSVVP